MFSLSKQEKSVLLLLAFVLFIGSLLRLSFKKFPFLKNTVNLIESDRLYFKVNVNTALFDELVAVPYIGPYTAKKIIQYREEKGRIRSLDVLKNIPGIREGNYRIFSKYLTVSGRPKDERP